MLDKYFLQRSLLQHLWPPCICIQPSLWFPAGYNVSLNVSNDTEKDFLIIFICLWLTHLICFFSLKLIGRSRIAWILSRVDRAASSSSRFCCSVRHKMTRQVLAVKSLRVLPFRIHIRCHNSLSKNPQDNLTPLRCAYHFASHSRWHPL